MISLLIASIIPLLLGPLLVRLLRPARWANSWLDGFVVVTISGLAVMHILPECFERGGWLAVGAAFVGLAVPTFAERALSAVPRRRWRIPLLVVALFALGTHAILDGVALGFAPQGPTGEVDSVRPLALAVVLHRMPVGIGIWWFAKTKLGLRAALTAVVVLIAGTLAGFVGGEALARGAASPAIEVFQALVAGSLLHALLGHGRELDPAGRASPRASAVGGLFAIGVLASMAHMHPVSHATAEGVGVGETFLALAGRSAPALLVAYAVVGISHAMFPRISAHWFEASSAIGQAIRGVTLGLPATICSCGVVPPALRRRAHDASPAASLAFTVCAGSLGIAAILLSFQLLGTAMAVVRLVGVVTVALVVGLTCGRLAGAEPHLSSCPPHADTGSPRGPMVRIADSLRFSFGETVDHTAPWFVMGLGTAAFVEAYVQPQWLESFPRTVGVVVLAMLGLPMYVCASGVTPLAAVLLHKGVSQGAVLALLLTGPATTLAVFGVPSLRLTRRNTTVLVAAIVVLAVGLGIATDVLLSPWGTTPRAHFSTRGVDTFELVSLLVFAVLVLLSLLRQGVRGFVQRIVFSSLSDVPPSLSSSAPLTSSTALAATRPTSPSA